MGPGDAASFSPEATGLWTLITQRWRLIGRRLLVNEIKPNGTDPWSEGLYDGQIKRERDSGRKNTL